MRCREVTPEGDRQKNDDLSLYVLCLIGPVTAITPVIQKGGQGHMVAHQELLYPGITKIPVK